MAFTINGLVYETINEGKEARLLRTEGLKRPVRNIPAEVEYDGKKYKVTEVYGGKSAYSITNGAFQDDEVLTNLSLPETITKILSADLNYSYTTIRKTGAFRGCPKLKEIYLPDSLVKIGSFAFHSCSAIESLYWGDNLKSIEEYAFSRCSALKEIDFNDKLEEIGSGAFYNCIVLKNVAFPESLKKIESSAFKGCKAMTEVNIPASVETIGSGAFADSGVKVVNIYSENINIASDAFPADAQINFLDANSFPKRKRKPRGNKAAEAPKPAPKPEPIQEPKPEPKKEESKPAPKPEPKKEEPKPEPKPVAVNAAGDRTAEYGVWKVVRHENNSMEVYKNGELCEKATPALREIAAELGMEVNPEWRTSQLGLNVLKAMQGNAPAASAAPAAKAEPEEEENAQEYDRAYWIEQSSELNLELVDHMIEIINSVCQFKYDLKYNKKYIGLELRGKSRVFVALVPQKGDLRISIYVKQTPEFDKILAEKLDSPDCYREDQYKFHVQVEDTEKKGGFFARLLGKTASNLDALKPLIVQAEKELR